MGTNTPLTFTCESCGATEELKDADILAVMAHGRAGELVGATLGAYHAEPARTRGNIALERDDDGNLVARRIIGQVETK